MVKIAIDTGTTFIRIAHFKNGTWEWLTLEEGIPSYVYLGETLQFGDSAKSRRKTKSTMVISNIKKLIGLRANDPGVREFCRNFSIEAAGDEQSLILIAYDNNKQYQYSVREVITEFFNYAISKVKEKVDGEIDFLCLTYPPSWNENMKREFYNCARDVDGIKHIQLITETAATCISAGYDWVALMKIM